MHCLATIGEVVRLTQPVRIVFQSLCVDRLIQKATVAMAIVGVRGTFSLVWPASRQPSLEYHRWRYSRPSNINTAQYWHMLTCGMSKTTVYAYFFGHNDLLGTFVENYCWFVTVVDQVWGGFFKPLDCRISFNKSKYPVITSDLEFWILGLLVDSDLRRLILCVYPWNFATSVNYAAVSTQNSIFWRFLLSL